MSAAAPDFADPPFHAPDRPQAGPVLAAGVAVDVGETVKYFSRDYRNGRREFAAIVTRVYPENPGVLDLVVVFDADDFMGQRAVPVRPADGEIGWEPVDRGVSRAEFDAFKDELAAVLFGEFAKPDRSFIDQILDLRAKVQEICGIKGKLEPSVSSPPKSSKRK